MNDDPKIGSAVAAMAGFDQLHSLVVVTEGPDLVVSATNAEARRLLGGAGLLGRPVDEALPPALGADVLERYDDVLTTGSPSFEDNRRVRLSLREGGTSEIVVDLALLPWLTADDEVRGVIVVALDVSQLVGARLRISTLLSRAEGLVTTMQDALLPDDLPVLPGLDVAARYLLSADDAAAGGDWFDALVRPSGRVALVVGDVVGHGVAASAVMGQLRAVLHERLLSGAPLATALADVDRFARSRPESRAATVAVLEIDPTDGHVEYCTAGHPPPLVIGRDGGTRYLPASGAGPLATGSDFAPCAEQLTEDELVLLYTDGLVQRPGRTHAQNTVELGQVMGHAYLASAAPSPQDPRTTERVCQQGLEALTRSSGHDDDITLVAAQRIPATKPFELRLPADLTSIGRVRRELGQWLDRLHLRPLDEFSVQHAVGELVTNVVEHAYTGEVGGDVMVGVLNDAGGDVVARVSDTGTWYDRREPLSGRGHGLAMARGLVDQVTVETGRGGTTVTARSRLTRPAQMLRDTDPVRIEVEGELALRPVDGGVRISGVLDSTNADHLRAGLRRATSGASGTMTLDLGGVTYLGSAGVQVLHEVVREATITPRLVAPNGTVAQHVLDLVRLPYDTS